MSIEYYDDEGVLTAFIALIRNPPERGGLIVRKSASFELFFYGDDSRSIVLDTSETWEFKTNGTTNRRMLAHYTPTPASKQVNGMLTLRTFPDVRRLPLLTPPHVVLLNTFFPSFHFSRRGTFDVMREDDTTFRFAEAQEPDAHAVMLPILSLAEPPQQRRYMTAKEMLIG